MNKEKLIDVIMGIFSIFFISIVFYLYFSSVFYNHFPFINNKNILIYNQTEKHSCHINIDEPTIILRMDDVRAYSFPTPYLVDEILIRQLAVTLGVIPKDLEKDSKMQEYLIKVKNNQNVEIAQHGTNHDESEKNITEDILLEGFNKIQKLLIVIPATYITPFNEISTEAEEIVSKYFKIISSREGILKEGKIAQIGQNAQTYYYLTKQYVPTEQIIEKCKLNLEKTNLCVINIHPQEYGINNLSLEKFQDFKLMLDKLQELNVVFSTFKDLVFCEDAEVEDKKIKNLN